jgi:hypothetical protein
MGRFDDKKVPSHLLNVDWETWYSVGPLGTKYLADHGAQVLASMPKGRGSLLPIISWVSIRCRSSAVEGAMQR